MATKLTMEEINGMLKRKRFTNSLSKKERRDLFHQKFLREREGRDKRLSKITDSGTTTKPAELTLFKISSEGIRNFENEELVRKLEEKIIAVKKKIKSLSLFESVDFENGKNGIETTVQLLDWIMDMAHEEDFNGIVRLFEDLHSIVIDYNWSKKNHPEIFFAANQFKRDPELNNIYSQVLIWQNRHVRSKKSA